MKTVSAFITQTGALTGISKAISLKPLKTKKIWKI